MRCDRILPVRVVTFDAMNTLINPRRPVGRIYSDFARRTCDVDADASALDDAFRDTFRLYDRSSPCYGYQQCAGGSSLIECHRRWWTDVVTETFTKAGVVIDQGRLRGLSSELFYYFGTTGPWIIDPAADTTFRRLTRKGVTLAVLSNYDSRLRSILRHFRVDHYFRAYFLSGEIGLAKPNGELFGMVERALGAQPGEIVHIGDHTDKDYRAARSAGWRAILLGSTAADVDPSHTAVSLADVLSKL